MTAKIQGKHLHFDGVAGAAGDMTLGALIDVGVPPDVIRGAMQAMQVEPERLLVAPCTRRGIRAIDVKIRVEVAGHEHAHHPHVPFADIRARLASASITAGARARAEDIFGRIARAEAKLHDSTVDEVVFHEVGAIDSIADVVGAAAALDWLDPVSVSGEPVVTGAGSVGSAHGRLPVPAPASLEIMREAGAPIRRGTVERELLTPTGAAILAHAVDEWMPQPDMVPIEVGHGAGDAELEDRANILRVTVGDRGGVHTGTEVVLVEANVDDMTGELCGYVTECLLEQGALDVWWTPVTMKKNRPGFELGVLCTPERRLELSRAIIRETTTIGVRWQSWSRLECERTMTVVSTEFGDVTIKVARLAGREVNAAPEFRDCQERAREHDVAVKQVLAAAIAAYRASR